MRRINLAIGFACLAVWTAAGCSDPGTVAPPVQYDCSNFNFQGEVYNCEQLDKCDETNLTYRLACCECDPDAYCTADPTCVDTPPPPQVQASSCMGCHNGSTNEDYAGPGLTNPHPFLGSTYVGCVDCHGGNPAGASKLDAHVPPPPQIGDRLQIQNDPYAFFNRLTLVGLDKLPDYTVNTQTYSGLDYIQFVNPGDLRIVSQGRGCGATGCHGGQHSDWVNTVPIATETGFYSATLYTSGVPNAITEYRGWYEDTASDYGFRAVQDPNFTYTGEEIGRVGRLLEVPEKAQYGTGAIYNNPAYNAAQLNQYVYAASVGDQYANQIIPGSPLQDLVTEAVVITCGDCHLGSAGANNRYADFRSSGCTSCHMEYSLDGRSRSTDPNVNKLEPANPDAIAAPERPHVESHQIRNVAKILPGGAFLRGVSDKACVGCHQGSNRTVLQYWGIRLDQNQDLVNNFQYPANPNTFQNTAQDTRLYDPAVANNTFNGRNANQYILLEDYDADQRDDTPADIHYERGMGCIDCHGSRDTHGGTANDPTSGRIMSREDQTLGVQCESCHGGPDGYAETVPCVTYDGENATCPVDLYGNPLRNVKVDPNGDYWLTSRLDGRPHYVPQTKDVIVENNKRHPITGQLVYSAIGSYAMGRADGNPQTGTGPLQTNPALVTAGFSHSDKIECVGCHSAWTNNCIGCHLAPGYNANPANYFFSNTTGERIVLFQAAADFTYITPVPFFIGVGSRGRITQTAPGMKMFFRYDTDLNNVESAVFAFTDRNGNGNNPAFQGRGTVGALAHNKIMPHSQRGKVDANNEGPRYCSNCHLNVNMINNFGADYAAFIAALQNNDVANINFALLQNEIGLNTNNARENPFWVHMVAGLGSGLFYFDATGCPLNPLDANANRFYCNDAPANLFNPNNAVYALDKVVEWTGVNNSSSAHPFLDGNASADRAGALDPGLAGPLGAPLLRKLADPAQGLILDSWIDSNGAAQGGAANFL